MRCVSDEGERDRKGKFCADSIVVACGETVDWQSSVQCSSSVLPARPPAGSAFTRDASPVARVGQTGRLAHESRKITAVNGFDVTHHIGKNTSQSSHNQSSLRTLNYRSWNDLSSPYGLGSLALGLVVEVASVNRDVLVLLTGRRHDRWMFEDTV